MYLNAKKPYIPKEIPESLLVGPSQSQNSWKKKLDNPFFLSHKLYDCFNCYSFKLFGEKKKTHFVLVLKKLEPQIYKD